MKSIKKEYGIVSKIAFSMYSRIPMPRSEWTDENKSYAMCFFSMDRCGDRTFVLWSVSVFKMV